MGRETWRYTKSEEERAQKRKLHPVWRGIGCLLLVIFASLGYFFADWFLRENAVNNWIYMPPAIMSPSFAPWLPEGAIVKVVIAFLAAGAAFGIIDVIYALFFPMDVRPPDAPPPIRWYRRKH